VSSPSSDAGSRRVVGLRRAATVHRDASVFGKLGYEVVDGGERRHDVSLVTGHVFHILSSLKSASWHGQFITKVKMVKPS